MLYAFLRIFLVPLLFAGYIVYQLMVKKKKLNDIYADLMYAFVFIALYLGIYFMFIR